MRSFTTLLLGAVLILSANAASIDKRAISAPTRLCIDSLNTVTTQYEILKYSVNGYTAAQGWAGFLAMNQKLENVQVQLNQTTINCGTINGIAPSEEANTINLAYSKINSQAIPSLTLFIDKKPEIDKVVLLSNVTAARIGQLDQKSKALNARLVTKIPATHLEALNGYIAEIENQLEMVKVAYGTK